MATRIRKATEEQQKQYEGLHPLYGFIACGGMQCPVEYLGEGKDNPNYEALAPDGMQFIPDGFHSMLGGTKDDLIERVKQSTLIDCPEDCDCK